ncbi:amidohydrolase family protein [Ancylobacter mangrovi]|uniref:amidohydrolase family protein n=1 Tax=Ancylobacter mangrovi TaxID=2972472 RepID=UPI0021635BE0|nr:amidohydrolase family protein [Ancylobacter mangrovi]MCS0502053.1 amidohydrolase family protein [Ancylobacter mangrovi]
MPATVDTHVHVFERSLPLAARRRYQPDYDATAADLLGVMRPAGIARAILVQPSFLGTDNSYVIEQVLRSRGAFAGVAVIDPGMGAEDLATLRRAGIVGIRLNCIGGPAPDFSRGVHREMAERLAAAGLVIEIQAEGAQWRSIAPCLPQLPGPVLVDHFGRTPAGDASGGFEALLAAAAETENLWFKFSGPYRFADGAAAGCASALLAAVGPGRVVWGSDWPWTQFEGCYRYTDTLDWLARWVPDAGARRAILTTNPARLFGLTAFAEQ